PAAVLLELADPPVPRDPDAPRRAHGGRHRRDVEGPSADPVRRHRHGARARGRLRTPPRRQVRLHPRLTTDCYAGRKCGTLRAMRKRAARRGGWMVGLAVLIAACGIDVVGVTPEN